MRPNDLLPITKFCSEEVQRQRDDPVHVAGLIEAWFWMLDYENISEITPEMILKLGALAKPDINWDGFRTYPIRIGYNSKNNQYEIPYQVASLCDAISEGRIEAEDAYYEYEEIHPFGDGNGRTGKILYNWMNSSLRNPVLPHNRYGWIIP